MARPSTQCRLCRSRHLRSMTRAQRKRASMTCSQSSCSAGASASRWLMACALALVKCSHRLSQRMPLASACWCRTGKAETTSEARSSLTACSSSSRSRNRRSIAGSLTPRRTTTQGSTTTPPAASLDAPTSSSATASCSSPTGRSRASITATASCARWCLSITCSPQCVGSSTKSTSGQQESSSLERAWVSVTKTAPPSKASSSALAMESRGSSSLMVQSSRSSFRLAVLPISSSRSERLTLRRSRCGHPRWMCSESRRPGRALSLMRWRPSPRASTPIASHPSSRESMSALVDGSQSLRVTQGASEKLSLSVFRRSTEARASSC